MSGPKSWGGEKRRRYRGEEGGYGECGKDILDVICPVEAIIRY